MVGTWQTHGEQKVADDASVTGSAGANDGGLLSGERETIVA
ncbi:hypothetical protein ATJ78_0420 [Paramicrobacterium agarici]|uniref:Uncharacterized protein n=1 Tax=Paramicrobacterium agarici TaxID=630514 RepID=A0A2A9DSF0_9MICO|nr:hypothetical protein ATJ78_0420 [Microbacterium agarici]